MNDMPSLPPSPEDASGFTRGKRAAAYMSLALVGAVLWPIHENWRSNPRDDFPLSYYPMFSTKRDAVETFYYMVGLDAQGGRHYIPYRYAGPGGLNSTRRQIRKLVREGHATELAQKVAHRVKRAENPPMSEVVTVNICRGEFSVDDFYHGKKTPVTEDVRGSARVERSAL